VSFSTRGPGWLQAIFTMEHIMEHISSALNVPVDIIKVKKIVYLWTHRNHSNEIFTKKDKSLLMVKNFNTLTFPLFGIHLFLLLIIRTEFL
jgi:hypothetical protein